MYPIESLAYYSINFSINSYFYNQGFYVIKIYLKIINAIFKKVFKIIEKLNIKLFYFLI